jgi:hypothetical protein
MLSKFLIGRAMHFHEGYLLTGLFNPRVVKPVSPGRVGAA